MATDMKGVTNRSSGPGTSIFLEEASAETGLVLLHRNLHATVRATAALVAVVVVAAAAIAGGDDNCVSYVGNPQGRAVHRAEAGTGA